MQPRRWTRSMDNFNWVSRINSKPPVTQESLALGGGRPSVGHHRLSSRPSYPSGHPPRLPPPPCRREGSPHTWQCLGTWLGSQTPSLDDVHFQLTIPLLQADLHIPCNRPRELRPGSGLEAPSRTRLPISVENAIPFPCSQPQTNQNQPPRRVPGLCRAPGKCDLGSRLSAQWM